MRTLTVALALALAACATSPETVPVACENVQFMDGRLTALVRNLSDAPARIDVGARYFTAGGLELQGSPCWMPVDLAVGESRAITARCPFATAAAGRVEVRPRQ